MLSHIVNVDPVQVRVSRRLFELRCARGLDLDAVGDGANLPHRSVRAIELMSTTNLQFDQVASLAEHYDIDLITLLTRGETLKWAAVKRRRDAPDHTELDRRVRANLRRIRRGLHHGTKWLAEAANVPQTWLVRIESGEIKMLDLVRLERAAEALGIPLTVLLAPT